MTYSTSVYPYDCVCYILATFPDGTTEQGSGTLIGPHTVLTASHILWKELPGESATGLSVYPGYNLGGTPIPGQWIDHFFEIDDSNNVLTKATSQNDYAIIDFATDLTHFGYFGTSTLFPGGGVHVTGYPAVAGGNQTDQTGLVQADGQYSVLDYVSVTPSPGNSGGPVWIDKGAAGSPSPYLVGIVSTTGWAVELTNAIMSTISGWEAADAPLWNGTSLMAAQSEVSSWFANVLRVNTSFPAVASLAAQMSNQISSGQISTVTAVQQVIQQAEKTTSVATIAYEFFTGATPSTAGMDYLISPTGPNPNNLNSAYYQNFNIENRYINFAVNLGKLGAGESFFQANYGGLTLADALSKAYDILFGSVPSAAKVATLLNTLVPDGLGGSETRAQYFAFYGLDGPNGLGTKAAMVGWLMAEAITADLGSYAKSNDAFLTDVALNGAPFSVDLIGHYNLPGFAYLSS